MPLFGLTLHRDASGEWTLDKNGDLEDIVSFASPRSNGQVRAGVPEVVPATPLPASRSSRGRQREALRRAGGPALIVDVTARGSKRLRPCLLALLEFAVDLADALESVLTSGSSSL